MVISWVTKVVRKKALADQRLCTILAPSDCFGRSQGVLHQSWFWICFWVSAKVLQNCVSGNNSALIIDILISSTSTFTVSFWKRTAWSSVCPAVRKFPSPWQMWRIHPLSLTQPKSSLQVNLVLPYFCFMVGSVLLIIYIQCSLTAFFKTVLWSTFLRACSWSIIKLWAQTWILQSFGELSSSNHPNSRFNLILGMSALSWCVKRFVMIKYLQPFLSTSIGM